MRNPYVLSLHIIFVVCWFAALFYIVRLFIYAAEAQKKEEPAKSILTQQLVMMQKKLWYIIGWPAMIGTYVFGGWLLMENLSGYLGAAWMDLKLLCVFLLTLYHLQCQRILSQQAKGVFRLSSFKLRLFNELATVFLVAIVFLVMVKSEGALMVGLLGLFGFAAVLMLAVFIYKKNRKADEIKKDPATNPDHQIPPVN